MEFNEVQIVIIASAIIIAFIGIFITLFSLFQKKKLSFYLREKEQEEKFEKILTESGGILNKGATKP